jgi:pimeloyl-ACP methyl ester carboxylesterase
MRSVTLELPGPVHVAEWGEGPVAFVLVHGLGGSHLNWMEVAPRLALRGRVLAPDLPGFGLTPRAGRAATLGSERRLLHRVLRRTVTGAVVLVGNSMGGLLALAEAAAHPELVCGLVLVDPALPGRWGGRTARGVTAAFATYSIPMLGRRVVQRHLARHRPAEVVDGAFAFCAAHPERISGSARDAHVALERERHTESAENARAFVEAARSIAAVHLAAGGLRPLLSRVSSPTLVLHGAQDRLVSAGVARHLAALRPDWQVEILEEAGHIPMLEAPGRVLSVILSWLDDHSLAITSPASARAS